MEELEKDGHWVYARYVNCNGRIIRPRNGEVLRFWVNVKRYK